jgi:glycosyltransferase involved in cell wall biosynthesis
LAGVLVVTIDPCWPPISGGDLRNWQNALHATTIGPVTLASVAAPRETGTPEVRGIWATALSGEMDGQIWQLPPGGTPIDISLPATLRASLGALVAEVRPDVAIIESLPLHPVLPWLSGIVPWLVLDLHNVESDLRARTRPGWAPWSRMRRSREVAAIQAHERRAAEWADRIWVCSDVEAERFATATGRRKAVHVVPNGIPRAETVPAQMRARADATERGPALLFVGHLSYKPNVKAAKAVAKGILPLVRKRFPSSRLVLAGRTPHDRVRRLARGTVEVIGDPPDIAPLLWRADFVVLPIAVGGGTRIKALEAMAWGLPVIASHLAVEGLGAEDRRHVRLAETPEQFAAAIAELWLDREAYERQRVEARELAVRQFGPDSIARAIGIGLGRV